MKSKTKEDLKEAWKIVKVAFGFLFLVGIIVGNLFLTMKVHWVFFLLFFPLSFLVVYIVIRYANKTI